MAFRIWLSGWSVPADRLCVVGTGAFMTSCSTIRPPGPVPAMVERSMPLSAAIAFARGEAETRVSSLPLGKVGVGPAAGGTVGIVPAPIDGAAVIASLNAWLMSSSAPPMTPIKVPDITVAPSWTRTLRRMPDAKASRSMMALSVSISASTSPASTGSPSRFFHARRTPSSIVSVNFGITTRLAMFVLTLRLETANQSLQPSILLLGLSFRVRILNPRFLRTQIGAPSEIQLAAELRVALSLEHTNEFLECGSRRRLCRGDHVRGLISQNGVIPSVCLLKHHRPAEAAFACIEAGQLMFLLCVL